jgi:hypothetical protein
MGVFVVIGLSPRRFDRRQVALIAVVSVGVAMVQFFFPRFL